MHLAYVIIIALKCMPLQYIYIFCCYVCFQKLNGCAHFHPCIKINMHSELVLHNEIPKN